MLRLGAGISGGRGGGGGGIGGSFESSGMRVLGTGDVPDDELEFVGEVDVDDDEELADEACSGAEKWDLDTKDGGCDGGGGVGANKLAGFAAALELSYCSTETEADDEQQSSASASCCFLSSVISFSIRRIICFLLVTSSTAASSSAHSRMFSDSSRSADSLYLSSSLLLAASSASKKGTMATVSLSIFCSSNSTRRRDSLSWSCSMARSRPATSGGARAGCTCADVERGK